MFVIFRIVIVSIVAQWLSKINVLHFFAHYFYKFDTAFQKNITPYIQHARCAILTSHFEGFPMAIIESLAVGTPVISVDCETGPKEIIQNNFNGLLVPNHDDIPLSEAIKTMIENEKLYQTCKNNAQKSVEHLSLTTIAQQWKQLLSEK